MSKYLEIARETEGWIMAEELVFLYQLAAQSVDTIVEVGSYLGKSTIAIGGGSKEGTRHPVTTIDPCLGKMSKDDPEASGDAIYDMLHNNIHGAGLAGTVTIIREYSKKISTDYAHKVGFIFIDGLHDFESVKANFYEWHHRIVQDGIVCFHDYGMEVHPGVSQFVDGDETLRRCYRPFRRVASAIAFKRTAAS